MNTVQIVEPSSASKWLISAMSGLLFLIIASPFIFKITQKIIGNPLGLKFGDAHGPTTVGLIVHSILFFLVVRLLMVN